MAPSVSFAKISLPYPVFAADFDPYNRGYLVVGGGGGESKTGVPNQISVLDIANRASIEKVAEIDLSRSEDSVQSLANLSTPDGLITFAGINSSRTDQDAGKNEHFRSFTIKYPPRKRLKTDKDVPKEEKPDSKIELLGKRSLFRASGPKLDTYQRLLRLSPARKREGGGKRIGAIASGFAGSKSEIVVFNATVSSPGKQDIICRIDLPDNTEAEDLDIAETQEGAFSLTYCTSSDVYEQTIEYDFNTCKSNLTPKGPRRISSIPRPEGNPQTKDKFRSIRFSDSENLIALVNKANRQGVVLRLFHIYPTGPANHVHHLDKLLPRRVKQASCLDVCMLDSDARSNRQVVIAVGGQDISIEVFTTNFSGSTSSFSPFRKCISLKDVHEHQMTKIVFSPYHSPARKEFTPDWTTGPNGEPIPPKKIEVDKHPSPQYLRLASISYGNTVVVDTFPLEPLEPSNRDTRYVLVRPGSIEWENLLFYGMLSFIVVVVAILAQSALQANGTGPGISFSLDSVFDSAIGRRVEPFFQKLSPDRRPSKLMSAVSSAALPEVTKGVSALGALLRQQQEILEEGTTQALVLNEDSNVGDTLSYRIHQNSEAALMEHSTAKHWHELSEEQKQKWKHRLTSAGHWVESEGEAVLKGVLFSEYAGFVGQIIADL